MNTIILSALFGVVMMFTGIFIHNRSTYKSISSVALLLLLLSRGNEFLFLLGISSSPFIAFLLGHPWEIVAGIAMLIILILFAHRENIQTALKPKIIK